MKTPGKIKNCFHGFLVGSLLLLGIFSLQAADPKVEKTTSLGEEPQSVQSSKKQENLPLFAKVYDVAEDDFLIVRNAPNEGAKKVGSLPGGGHEKVGFSVRVDQKLKKGGAVWYRISPLCQVLADGFSEPENAGWVNGKFLREVNRGYVIVDNHPSCDYALRAKDGKCEVVVDVDVNEKGDVTRLYKKWISRKRLKGTSNFGAMSEGDEGYCTIAGRIEEYLKQKKNNQGEDNDVDLTDLRTIQEGRLIVQYPSFLTAKSIPHEGVILMFDVPLKHYSGSDMRDEPKLLTRKTLFRVQLRVYDSLESALVSEFPEVKKEEMASVYQYDPVSDWFKAEGRDAKSQGLGQDEVFYGKPSHEISIGVEGSGIHYHFFKQGGCVVVFKQWFDHNPPINPQNHQPIPGDWNFFSPEKEILQMVLKKLKIKPESVR